MPDSVTLRRLNNSKAFAGENNTLTLPGWTT